MKKIIAGWLKDKSYEVVYDDRSGEEALFSSYHEARDKWREVISEEDDLILMYQSDWVLRKNSYTSMRVENKTLIIILELKGEEVQLEFSFSDVAKAHMTKSFFDEKI